MKTVFKKVFILQKWNTKYLLIFEVVHLHPCVITPQPFPIPFKRQMFMEGLILTMIDYDCTLYLGRGKSMCNHQSCSLVSQIKVPFLSPPTC